MVQDTNFSSYDGWNADVKKPAFGDAQGDVIGIDLYAEMPNYLAQLKTSPNNATGLENVIKYIQANGDLEAYPKKNTLQFEGLLDALNPLTSVHQGASLFE